MPDRPQQRDQQRIHEDARQRVQRNDQRAERAWTAALMSTPEHEADRPRTATISTHSGTSDRNDSRTIAGTPRACG